MLKILFPLMIAFLAATPVYAVDEPWLSRWRADLESLRARLPEVHPAPFDRISSGDFNDALSGLADRLSALSHGEITTELARIVAMIGDGHTRLTWPLAGATDFVLGHAKTEPPTDAALLMHTYPLRVGVYSEGIFVERVVATERRLLGAQLLGIDELSTEQVIARLAPLISRDNDAQFIDLLPLHLVIAEALHARGIASKPDSATFRFRLEDGRDVAVPVSIESTPAEWAATTPAMRRPISWQKLLPARTPGRGAFSERHWVEWLPSRRTIYLQINESYDDPEETLFDLASRLRAMIKQHPVEALVVDLRYNFGGDNTLNQPLLHAIIASDEIRRPGRLRVLIGRGTFSAAMMLALDLEKHVKPVFVGEPTGSTTNAFGDSRKTVLAETGITVRISSRYHQYGGAEDQRRAIAPHIEVPPSWRALRAGVDEALEIALAPPPTQLPEAQQWSGRMTLHRTEAPVALRLARNGGEAELTVVGIAENLKISERSLKPERIELVAELDGEPFRFEAIALGRYLVGHAVYANRRGNPFPFALAPQTVTRDPAER